MMIKPASHRVSRTPGSSTRAPSTEANPFHQRSDRLSSRSVSTPPTVNAIRKHNRTSTSSAAKTRPRISLATFSCNSVNPSTYEGPASIPSTTTSGIINDSRSTDAAASSTTPAPISDHVNQRVRWMRVCNAEAAPTPTAMPTPSENSTAWKSASRPTITSSTNRAPSRITIPAPITAVASPTFTDLTMGLAPTSLQPSRSSRMAPPRSRLPRCIARRSSRVRDGMAMRQMINAVTRNDRAST